MAQSAATELPPIHLEAPAHTTTSITTVHRNLITSPDEVPINVFLPLNPDLATPVSGPAVVVTNTPSDSSPDSSAPQENAANVATDDEDNVWLAMAMTFNDLYQGLTEDDTPPLTKVNDTNANALAPNNNHTTDFGLLPARDDKP